MVLSIAISGLAGCRDKPTQPMGEIHGEPINAPQARAGTPNPIVPASNSNQISTGAPATVPGYLHVGFDKLSAFKFEPGEEVLNPQTNGISGQNLGVNAMIPEKVKSLDEKKASIRGFMLPLRVEGGLVTELLIMRDQSMCCYGVVPKINEWVSVKMHNKGVKAIMDQPVTMYGTLHIGEMRENGYLVGIYRFDAERMETSQD
jgi:hypothetical protein